MYSTTCGPWHEGFAVNCEVLGAYVTIICTNPDVAEAVAALLDDRTPRLGAQPAMVGRRPVEAPSASSRRRIS